MNSVQLYASGYYMQRVNIKSNLSITIHVQCWLLGRNYDYVVNWIYNVHGTQTFKTIVDKWYIDLINYPPFLILWLIVFFVVEDITSIQVCSAVHNPGPCALIINYIHIDSLKMPTVHKYWQIMPRWFTFISQNIKHVVNCQDSPPHDRGHSGPIVGVIARSPALKSRHTMTGALFT